MSLLLRHQDQISRSLIHVYDIHSPRVPSVEEIVTALTKMRAKIEDSKLWVNPDCGLKTRGNEETVKSLKNLVAAAKQIRG